MRKNPSNDSFGLKFNTAEKDKDITENEFSDIIRSVQCASFAKNNPNQIASRDYMFIKIWDIRKNDVPL
jgi:hypothetical protein